MIDAVILASRDLTLRAACADDVNFERQVFESARPDLLLLAAWPADVRKPFLDQQFAFQSAHYARSHPHAFRGIIHAGGEPIGRFIFDRGAEEWCVLDIALMPDWRGRGLGGTLLLATQTAAARAGVPVTLTVDKLNPARRLYERLGFTMTGEAAPNIGMAWCRG